MNLVINMEKCLANIVKKKLASQTIVSVVGTSGSRYLDTKSLNSEFALFYSNLYNLEQPDNAFDLMHSFFSDLTHCKKGILGVVDVM